MPAKTQVRTALVASASQAAGATTRGRLDCTGVDGGILTFRITNGGTGPTAQCVARVMIAHRDTAMPAAAAEGPGAADWKTVYEIGGGTAANGGARGVFRIDPSIAYVQIEFTGNTGQPVTVECYATTFNYP